MGFLEDIGRSGAMNSVNNVMERAIQLRQQEDQGAERAFNASLNMEKLGMEKVQNEENNRRQNKLLEIQTAQEARAAEEHKAKIAKMTRRLPVSMFLGPKESWTGSKQLMVGEALKMGAVKDEGGVLTVSPEDFEMFKANLDPSKALEISAANLQEIEQEAAMVAQKLQKNPQDEKALAEKDRLTGMFTAANDAYNNLKTRLEKDKVTDLKFVDIPGGGIPGTEAGKHYKGILKGKDPNGNPVYTNVVEVPATEAKGTKEEMFRLWKQDHPNATPKEQLKERERIETLGPTIRAEAFATRPTNTPGVLWDGIRKKYFRLADDGTQVPVSSEEAYRLNLQYTEDKPTTDLKVMRQSVPSVLHLSGKMRSTIQANKADMGPANSRWRAFWEGKIGAPDPSWATLKTEANLLSTRLMKMHVGSRGGVEMVNHFKELLAAGKQSPENLIAALDVIDAYAKETAASTYEDLNPKETSDRHPTKDGKTTSPNVIPRRPGESVADYLKRTGK